MKEMNQTTEVEYRSIEGFPNYRAGTDGSIWSKSKNTKKATEVDGWHLVQGGLDKDGYRKIILCNGNIKKHCRFHIVVLRTFKGPPPSDMKNPTCAHNNGNKADNRLENLRWATQKDNIADKALHGTAQTGEKGGTARLTSDKVREIRRLREGGIEWSHIANRLGEKKSTVYAAGVGRNWKHV